MSHTRRDFLKAGLGASTLLSAGSSFLLSSLTAAPRRDERDTVLVVVQLSGGNDGLNTLVPYADDEYGRNRTTLRLPTKELHKIDSQLGFHPRMEAFMRLYKAGRLSIIQGVGYQNTDRSHEGGMRIWHTADPRNANRQTGWLGRAIDNAWTAKTTKTPAVFVGPISQPFALNAQHAIVPSIDAPHELTAAQMPGHPNASSQWKHLSEQAGADNPLLDFLRRSTSNACTVSERINAAAENAASSAEYPSFALAGTLRKVAQLIRADVGIRIFFTELGGGGIGGFDNHANQLGNHCSLLGHLSESIAAFVRDLKRDKQLDRVLLMTFSEFGRTLKENGRRGTGHGAAAPIFLAGGRLKGGLIGKRPSLTDLDNGAPRFGTDFRRIYATVLDRWLGFDSRAVLDKQFEPLDILSA